MNRNTLLIIALIFFVLFFFSQSEDSNSPHWDKLKTLRPDVRKYFIDFIKDIEARGYKVIVTDSTRTPGQQAYQHKVNPKNPATGGTHVNKTAIDLNLIAPDGTQLKKSTPKEVWLSTGIPQLAKNKYGMRWGGDFKTYHDPIHYEYKLTA